MDNFRRHTKSSMHHDKTNDFTIDFTLFFFFFDTFLSNSLLSSFFIYLSCSSRFKGDSYHGNRARRVVNISENKVIVSASFFPFSNTIKRKVLFERVAIRKQSKMMLHFLPDITNACSILTVNDFTIL